MSTELEDKVEWCIRSIMQIQRELQPKPSKPWYTSFSTWLVILLVIGMMVIIYLFYLSELGWTMLLPGWMK